MKRDHLLYPKAMNGRIFPSLPSVVVSLLLLSHSASAQYINLDSLKQVAARATTDSQKITTLTLLADNYVFNTDSEFHYATLAKNAAAKAGNQGAEAYAIGDIAESIERKGNYGQALKLELQILKTFQELKDTPRLANTYNGIGNLYRSQNNPHLAKQHYLTCLTLAHRVNDYRDEFFGAVNGSLAYSSLGQYDSALYYEMNGLRIIDSKQFNWSRAAVLMGVSGIYHQLHQDSLSEQYFREALENAERLNDPFLSNIQITYANKLLSQNKLDSALDYANRAAPATERNGQLAARSNLYYLFSQIYNRKKQFEQAYQYLDKTLKLKDSLNSTEQSRQVATLTFAEQQREIDLQNAATAYQNRLRWYGALGVLALAVVVVFFLVSRTKKQQKANALLQQQKAETETQRTKAEEALEELKATQAQLVQREKMASLGELTAGIAHEIQNPLNFVNNFSEANRELIDEAQSKLVAKNYAELSSLLADVKSNEQKIIHHGKRADAIVTGMLQHSRSSTGTKEPTDINALVEECLKLSYHGMRSKDKTFESQLQTNLDDTLGKIEVVPQEIGRVLLNLFNNAYYAVNEKKKLLNGQYTPLVSVSTRRLNNAIEIQVSDNGTGIAPHVMDKIFQPFFTSKPTGEGTGLGLSLSYDIVTKGHGGKLTVESEEGQSTSFLVRLPA